MQRSHNALLSSPHRSTEYQEVFSRISLVETTKDVGPVFLIGVSGGTASGKTTVCDRIISSLGDVRVSLISLDNFYRGLTSEHDPANYNFDHPDAFDYDTFHDCLCSILEGNVVDVPTYSFVTHSRLEEVHRVFPTPVVIVEGILIFHDKRVRDLMHMKVFVDTDADTRLLRRISRDIKERGRTYESVLKQYERFVKPSYDEFIAPTKRFADIIIPHWPNEAAVDLISQHVRGKMQIDGLSRRYSNLFLMPSTATTRYLHTLIRDRNCSRADFVFYADRLIRLVVEYGGGTLPFRERTILTPMNEEYCGVDMSVLDKLCAVSIVRGGESMESAISQVYKDIRIGKILFKFPESNNLDKIDPKIVYVKLPHDVAQRYVFLLDPVLGRGLSVRAAIKLLLSKGVLERNIVLLSLMASPQVIKQICKQYPEVKFITTEIDTGINSNGLLVPGIGSFADRYFGLDYCHTNLDEEDSMKSFEKTDDDDKSDMPVYRNSDEIQA